MTTADLRAYVDAADAYKRQDATIAQMTLLLNCFPTSDAVALARIALAAQMVYHDHKDSVAWLSLGNALFAGGLLTPPPQQEPKL